MANSLSGAKATKKSKKAVDINLNNVKLSKKDKNKIKKSLKKPIIIFAVVFFIIGCIGGYFAYNFICGEDCFVMNEYFANNVDCTIGKNETFTEYEEKGAKCVAFKKDISNLVKIEYFYREDMLEDEVKVDKIDVEKAGIYYVVYTINNIKYSNVKLIRNVIVVREEA